jgi:hypothetical protein
VTATRIVVTGSPLESTATRLASSCASQIMFCPSNRGGSCQPRWRGIAWWAAVRRGGSPSPNSRLVAVYDRVLIPATQALERVVRVPLGESILGIARV